MNKFPLPTQVSNDELVKLLVLVEQAFGVKKANPDADTRDLEDKIDGVVYGMYGLGRSEIDLIERRA